jgi:hypothetical protein
VKIPSQINIVDSSFFLDGGTLILQTVAGDGANHAIRLNQRIFAPQLGFNANPGRLYFDDELVEVRSDIEAQIVQLLKDALVIIFPEECSSGNNPPMSKNALILGDDIRQVLESSPLENLQRFRNEIVEFVESDEYVRIATRGISQ